MRRARILPANEERAIAEAAAALRAGGLVVLPTDTVYGVGALALLPEAVEKLYLAKLRPRDRAIPVLLSGAEQLPTVARCIPDLAWRAARRFWPGGLTLVLRRAPELPAVLCAGGETVAVRVPHHPVALALIAAAGGPLAATSANLSGQPPAVTAEEAAAALAEEVEIILDGGRAPLGVPSTVWDLTVDPPRVLRQGAIAEAQLAELLAETSHPNKLPETDV